MARILFKINKVKDGIIVGQIPEVISYQANAQGIQTQNAVSDILLNIKA